MIETKHRMTPAYKVIERLGGKAAVAEQLNIDKSTLSRWCSPSPKGTNGRIPQKHWSQLIAIARRQNVRLSLNDLAAL